MLFNYSHNFGYSPSFPLIVILLHATVNNLRPNERNIVLPPHSTRALDSLFNVLLITTNQIPSLTY